MKINIIHYPPLVDRKKYLQSKLPDANFLTDYKRENLTQELISMYIPDEQMWYNKCSGLYNEIPPFRTLKLGDISCSIAHIKLLEQISKSDKPELILEDDAFILCNDFNLELEKIRCSLPKNWDIIFIGGAFNLSDITEIKSCFSINYTSYAMVGHPASNTVCAYIINPLSAKLLSDNLQTFTLPIDFELNFWMKKLNMNIYHVTPYLIREGSSMGLYRTSQEIR